MKKMLIAIDGSNCSLRALLYVGEQFSDLKDLQVTLLYVIPYPPAQLWDNGHIPTEEEKEKRGKSVKRWFIYQGARIGPLFDKALAILVDAGISRPQLATKTISDSSDIADSILEEAKDGGYQTLVVGKCSSATVKNFLMGSVTTKIIKHSTGVVICVVE